jgi:hypothetical protein
VGEFYDPQAESSQTAAEDRATAPTQPQPSWAPGPAAGEASYVGSLASAGVDRRAHAVLSLQRGMGNHATSAMLARQPYGPLPPGPVGNLIGSLMQGKSTIERVKDLLTYGVIDWAVTDEDAAKATQLLGDMGDGDLTSAVATLDGDAETPYLDRLVTNATLKTVRTPAFGKIMRKRAPARNKVLAEQLVSYGFFDWEITPAEADAAQTLLDSMPPNESDRLVDGWVKERIKDNLHKDGDYEEGVGEMLLDGALQGDLKEDPTFWSTVGQIVAGCVPYVGQVADARDLVVALDKIINKEGWKSGWEWANLVLVAIGFIPGAGDAVKALGKSALRGLRHAGLKVLGGLFEAASRHLIQPLVKHLIGPAVDSIKRAMKRVADEADRRVQRFLRGEPHPHGEGKVVDEALDSLPNPAKIEADAQQAIDDAAAGAGRRFDDVVGEMVHSIIEWLKDWCRRIFGMVGLGDITVTVEGEWLVFRGSKLIRVRIKDIKDIPIKKTQELLSKIKERQGKLIAARNAATDEARNLLRNDACQVSEEIGERVAEIMIKREFGVAPYFVGKGSGVVDQVYKKNGMLYVVEAKGGGSRLGWREVGADEFAQQGTLTYLDSVIGAMINSSNADYAKMGKELLDARDAKKVIYMIAKTGPLDATSKPIAATLTTIVQ